MLDDGARDDEFMRLGRLDQERERGLDDAGVPFADLGVLVAVRELERGGAGLGGVGVRDGLEERG